MDNKIAGYLLGSLLERVNRDQIGTVSGPEREAIGYALKILLGEEELAGVSAALSPSSLAKVVSATESSKLPHVDLTLDSLDRKQADSPNVLLCLDFGTAMSKAFASTDAGKHLDLELGKKAGRTGYTLPSSAFIGDNGRIYFGFEAIEMSQDLIDSGRERLDSIKSWLSNRQGGDLDGDASILPVQYNPTQIKLTEGDLIRVFLAYLTDMATSSLSERDMEGETVSRYVKRRFARPCWPNEEQTKWADGWMRGFLAEAQVLADTFHGQWEGGIDAGRVKAAIEKAKTLEHKPDFLLDVSIPEPVAVAAGALSDSDNLRDAYMVVDVGAGTTDFGLFVVVNNEVTDEHKVFQISQSIHGLMQAGDKVDGLLRAFIKHQEAYDSNDAQGRLIEADLRRRIRDLKEQLFKTGSVEYALADGTVGHVEKGEFLDWPMVQQFAKRIEEGFLNSLEAVDNTWLKWLAMDGVELRVVLTGGSSRLPMMQALGSGVIDVKGHRILRRPADPLPDWMEDAPEELRGVYPQLAVAIGGAEKDLPETAFGPDIFGGGSRTTYVPGKMQVTGS